MNSEQTGRENHGLAVAGIGRFAGNDRPQTGKIAGSVAMEYDKLAMVIERLEMAATNLRQQLEPIMGHEAPHDRNEEMKEPSQPAPLANGIREQRYRLEKLERFINSISNQIEL